VRADGKVVRTPPVRHPSPVRRPSIRRLLDSPPAIRGAHGLIGLAVILGCQLRSCVAHRRDVAGREGGRPLLIPQETVQAFIRDLADRLAPAACS
jgi:hypothetical protein